MKIQSLFIGQSINPKIIFDKKVNKKIIKDNYDLYFTSHSKRTIQTSKYFIKNKKIQINKLLNEIDYGLAEGKLFSDLKKEFPFYYKQISKNLDYKFPKGENYRMVQNRLAKFIKFILGNKKFQRSKILVITHNVVLRNLIGLYLNLVHI